MSLRVVINCQNISDSYGEICVYCNKCKRFSSNPEERKKEKEIQANKIIEWLKINNLNDPKNYPLL